MSPERDGANPWTEGWEGEIATRWVALEDALDRALAPFGDAALARANPQPGERAIDVGCGCGATVLALAAAVGARGQVLGVDIAPEMLARARERTAGLAQVELLQADAQTHVFGADHDLVFSRCGVMFFGDERAAFANLARALGPGGRLSFVCWRPFADNPWMNVAFSALRQVMPEVAPPPVEGPGPFAFADAGRTRELLAATGFGAIAVEAFDHPVSLGADLAAAVRMATGTGPTGRALPAADPPTRARVREKIAAALAPYQQPQGVLLPGAAWVVYARR